VLDVGCGQGIDVARFALAGARATGVDLTPRHAELARMHLSEMGLDATVANGDAEVLPFADASFDRASSNGVLHHTPDILGALREVRRVLRPGGEARILVYNRSSFHYWLAQVLYLGIWKRALFEERSMEGVLSRGVEKTSIDARPLVRVYSPRQVRKLMREAGFVGVRTSVRHLRAADLPILSQLAARYSVFERPTLYDRLGRIGGWYVVGFGIRPAFGA
jgi:ubiquinone/menaquinone biosynthesis C-methylase UbiE